MPNRLVHETSPYLRQHADNPVDWYPWGEEAFARAKAEDKPIHLSVGYAACHWCHVMAHESFENPEVARLLNDHFISIKVDRQERPDIDDIYQQVIQMMNQGGGWPLTVFMTSDARPFFAGTYFPPHNKYGRPGLLQLLPAIVETWKNRRGEIDHNISQLLKGFEAIDNYHLAQELPRNEDLPAKAAQFFAEKTDLTHGGLGGAPKFPNVSCYDLVLRVYHRTQNPKLLQALEITLNHMADGGIYDHLGGGFARYSVDERWAVPHFEKMLYDNGQLVKLYADAYRLIGNPKYRRVVEETIDYVLRDMTHQDGGFYASEDADSEGEEGKFYVWTPDQIKEILGEQDGDFACRALGVTEQGNFDHHTTVLYRAIPLNEDEEERLSRLKSKLFTAREKRARPQRDDNIITSWNSLMIQGLCAAYQATGTDLYLETARRATDFILENMAMKDGGVYRVWYGGMAKVPGFLDDYAYFLNALLDLYESCFDRHYLDHAICLGDLILKKFWMSGLYMTSSNSEKLVHRPRAVYDHALPSGNSASLFAFFRLYEFTGKDLYRQRGEIVWRQYGGAAAQNPFSFAHLLAAHDFIHQGPLVLIIAGDRNQPAFKDLIDTVHRLYCPNRILAVANDVTLGKGREPMNSHPTIYPCRHQTCGLPLTDPKALHQYLQKSNNPTHVND